MVGRQFLFWEGLFSKFQGVYFPPKEMKKPSGKGVYSVYCISYIPGTPVDQTKNGFRDDPCTGFPTTYLLVKFGRLGLLGILSTMQIPLKAMLEPTNMWRKRSLRRAVRGPHLSGPCFMRRSNSGTS